MTKEIEKVGREIVLKAGEVIRRFFGNGSSFDVRDKNISDYVTSVDLESEALIIREIKRHFPDHHIMAEESAHGKLQSGITWIIDPLDGTTNFIHGFPFVCVSIAVYMENRTILGFIYDPVRQELFTASRGEGAYCNGERISVRNGLPVAKALIATGFPFRSRAVLDPYLDSFRQVFIQVSGIRRAGSAALDLAYLAAGRVDGFWEVGLKAWDVAAGALMVEEAGGKVSDFWEKGDFLNNGHIVAGADLVYPCLMEAVRTHLSPVLSSGQV
jgi:myo-inositol-1(or 4)-monophosphatase